MSLSTNHISVLQSGLPKSGNLWLYRIIQAILERSEYPYASFIRKYRDFNLTTGIQDDKELYGHDVIEFDQERAYVRFNRHSRIVIHDIDAYIRNCTHLWTHSSATPIADTIFPKLSKIVYIVRDPRDAAISASKFAFTPEYVQDYQSEGESPEEYLGRELVTFLKRWGGNVSSHLKLREKHDVHFVYYENILADPVDEIRRLVEYLGIAVSEEGIEEIRAATSFETMAEKENPGHVRKGRSNAWVDALTKEQQATAAKLAGPLMRIMDYPVKPKDISTGKRLSPQPANASEVQNALKKLFTK